MSRVLHMARQKSVLSSGRRGAIIGLICLITLAACGGDGSGVREDRRFATDPGDHTTDATASASSTTSVTATAEPTSEPPTVTSSASPVPVMSDIETVFALVDEAVVAVDVRSGATRVIARSQDNNRAVRVAASPDGALVAIVWRKGADDSVEYELEIRDRGGEIVTSWTDVSAPLGEGGDAIGRAAVDWSDLGGKIAVAFPSGGAVLVPVAGEPAVLLTREQAPAPLSIEWAPNGDAIAFTSRMPDSGSAYLAIASVQALPVDPVRIAGTGDARPIFDLAWLPGGSSLLAVQGSAALPDQVGGDLIQVDRRTLSARFAIGASRFGPSAEIVTVEASPDGRQWAIVTVAPDARGGLTAAVWLVSPDLATITRIGLADDPPVAGITWTVAGLSITLFEPDRVRLVTVDRMGAVIALEEPPSASPVASPVVRGTPVATPIAPPIAQPDPPVATPSASPVASPAPDPHPRSGAETSCSRPARCVTVAPGEER